jgi:hypothetical protein
VHYNSQGLVPKDLGYMCRVSLCPHYLVFLLGGLWENLLFVGAIFIGLTNFPRGPRGLPAPTRDVFICWFLWGKIG